MSDIREKPSRNFRVWAVAGALVAVAAATIAMFPEIVHWESKKTPTPAWKNVKVTESDRRILAVYEEHYQTAAERILALDTPGAGETLNAANARDTLDDLYFRGLLHAWKGDHPQAAGLLSRTTGHVRGALRSPLLEKHAKAWRIDLNDLAAKTFSEEDSYYLLHCHLLQQIATRVTEGCRNERDKAARLTDWVFHNAASFEPEPEYEFPVGILVRGFGLSKRSTWVLALLAERAGLKTAIVLFDRSRRGVQFDALCAVTTSEGTLLCDSGTGRFVEFEGKPVTLEAIVARLGKEPNNTELQATFGPLRNAMLSSAFQAEGTYPRFERLEAYARVVPPYASVYVDLEKRTQALQSIAVEEGGTSLFSSGIWKYPYTIVALLRDPGIRASREEKVAVRSYYESARFLQLLGHSERALVAYAQAAKSAPGKPKESMLYFMAQCRLEMGRPKAAKALFEEYLRLYPDGMWRRMATFQLAEIAEESGERSEAKRLYESILPFKAAERRLADIK